jgi:cellulose synthase/poly-beta-1,6-N-acetylglucosamine synthase-like glycosyltransferase
MEAPTGNIAMNIIRNGYRFLYVPNAIVYEPSPENLKQHRLQKVRRAKRLLQVFLKNRDVALNSQFGSFGRMIFPLKLLMFALCPTLIFVGFALIALFVILSNDLLLQALTGIVLTGLLTLTLVFKRVGRITSSFVLHQFYLIVGLLTSIRKSVYWKTIERKTKLNF